MSEAAVQAAIRIRASELGVRLFRNNVGACVDETGRVIRYGLANDSAQLQKRLKSSDLVGWCTVSRVVVSYEAVSDAGITPGDPSTYTETERLVPMPGVVLAIECKTEDWMGGYPNAPDPARFNAREIAQQAWIDLVRSDGGIAFFARSVEEFEHELKKAGWNA